MKNKTVPLYETLFLIIGELIVSLIICGVYLIIDAFGKDAFSYKVITGAALGGSVTVINFLFLVISTNKAFNKAVEMRGDKEMDEDEIANFTEKHTAEFNNAVKLSFIVRTLTMLAALVVAFITKQFDVIATVIPLLMFRPIITVATLLKQKLGKGGG